MKTTFTILARYRLDSHESNNSEFLSEDLIDIICNDDSIIITEPEYLNAIKKDHPKNKFLYTITIESTDNKNEIS